MPRPHRAAACSVTSPERKLSANDVVLGDAHTENNDGSKRKPQPRLLHHVVREEKLKGAVSRLTRPTQASLLRASNHGPGVAKHHVSMNRYTWCRLGVYAAHQRHVYTNLGAVQPGFKRMVKAPDTSSYLLPPRCR